MFRNFIMQEQTIIDILCRNLDWKVQQKCNRRYDFLCRQYSYLLSTENNNLLFSLKNGWFEEKYKVLFALNSFYQIVIAPLSSATNSSHNSIGIGSSITVSYGKSIKINRTTQAPILSAFNDYLNIVNQLGFDEWLLISNETNDIVYNIAKYIEN